MVYVRGAKSEDTIPDGSKPFGFGDPDMRARVIGVATGAFRTDTNLVVTLYLVRSETVQEVDSLTLGASSSRLRMRAPFGERLSIKLVLGEKETTDGRLISLGSVGQTAGAGAVKGGYPHDVIPVHSQSLPGRITPGRPYIIYVEGGQSLAVDRGMSLEEFARLNKGNYVVVTAELQ